MTQSGCPREEAQASDRRLARVQAGPTWDHGGDPTWRLDPASVQPEGMRNLPMWEDTWRWMLGAAPRLPPPAPAGRLEALLQELVGAGPGASARGLRAAHALAKEVCGVVIRPNL
jgi:hypothetical protein